MVIADFVDVVDFMTFIRNGSDEVISVIFTGYLVLTYWEMFLNFAMEWINVCCKLNIGFLF